MNWKMEVGAAAGEMVAQLEAAGVKFNAYAERLLAHPSFAALDLGSYHVTKMSVRDLGLSAPSTFAEIVSRAESRGVRLCPLGLAAPLRLAYLDQPAGPYFTIASAMPEVSEDFPNGFYLRNFEGSLWLRGYRASADWEFSPESEFGFLL
jgi:hypothetical protein